MNYIESAKNEKIKQAKKLTTKKGQQQSGQYLLEGLHLVSEAIQSGIKPEVIYATEKFTSQRELRGVYDQIIEISDEVAEGLSDTTTTQGIFAVVPLPERKIPTDLQGKWLLLDAVQDPGNVGTMVRTADAAGFTGVVCGKGTVDCFAPKVVRAMQGSQFHLQLLQGELTDWVSGLQAASIPVYGTELNAEAKNYTTVEKTDDVAVVMGNEGNGMNPELLKQTTNNLFIPIKGKAESLNVAVAAGILLYHFS